jgi:hypothetical protein
VTDSHISELAIALVGVIGALVGILGVALKTALKKIEHHVNGVEESLELDGNDSRTKTLGHTVRRIERDLTKVAEQQQKNSAVLNDHVTWEEEYKRGQDHRIASLAVDVRDLRHDVVTRLERIEAGCPAIKAACSEAG